MYVRTYMSLLLLLLFHTTHNTGININVPIFWGSYSGQQVIPEVTYKLSVSRTGSTPGSTKVAQDFFHL